MTEHRDHSAGRAGTVIHTRRMKWSFMTMKYSDMTG